MTNCIHKQLYYLEVAQSNLEVNNPILELNNSILRLDNYISQRIHV